MRATSIRIMDDEPEEIEALLPWYAAGTLSVPDAQRVEEALTHDAALRKQYAVIQEEYAETIHLNESLGAPSTQTMQKLFTAIDAEPPRKAAMAARGPAWLGAFLSGLSPRTLSWSASLGALVLVAQAGVIGAVLMRNGPESFQSPTYREQISHSPAPATIEQPKASVSAQSGSAAPTGSGGVADTAKRNRSMAVVPSSPAVSASPVAPSADAARPEAAPSIQQQPGAQSQAAIVPPPKVSRSLGGANADVVIAVTFRPDARMSDISAFLGSYHAVVIGNDGGTFRLQFEGMTSASDRAVLLSALRNERIVASAAP